MDSADRRPLFVLYAGYRRFDFGPGSGLEVTFCDSPELCPGLTRRPDVLLIDPPSGESGSISLAWLKAFKKQNFRFPPAYFSIVSGDTGPDERLDLMAKGFDHVLEWPISPRDIVLRSRIHVEKNLIARTLYSKEASLEKAFGYLDRFKAELKLTKDELGDEKSSLNTALKQIQQMTLERRRLKNREAALKETARRNMEGFGHILHTLVQHRVERNRGHGERVARIALFVAKELGFDEKKLEDLRKAAMLHEIGLLFLSEYGEQPLGHIPGGVLDAAENKWNRPSAYDETLMVQFPVKGAQLLNHCPGFEAPARIIQAMNENSDGTGYPDRLKRRYIPLASKILAGADELEGLRDRADIKGVDPLLAGLEKLAGVRLDPVIVGWLEKYVVLHMGADDFKVRGVGIEQLEPGMELGTALFTTTGTKLFTANTVLTRDLIDKIIQYHREYPVDATVYIKV